MKVKILERRLTKRDADISELTDTVFREVELESYLKRSEMWVSKQRGKYKSIQGANLTPQPFWCIEFDTVSRRSGDNLIIQARTESTKYHVTSARWAKVAGTGQQKQKWRHLELNGAMSIKHIMSVVTSAWLVPFCIAHRFMAVVPAHVVDKHNARLVVLNPMPAQSESLSKWIENQKEDEDETIISWVKKAQKLWTELKTDKSSESVTGWVNYLGKLENQSIRSVRVVHTRSRSLYAAVLNPKSETALGLPLSKVILKSRTGDKILATTKVPLAGCIIDNLLHHIEVSSLHEAYWLTGIFNSKSFGDLVMERAGGKRGSEYVPSIYSLPVKLLQEMNIAYDGANQAHKKIAHYAKLLEMEMRETVRNYILREKEIDLKQIDDTIASPEVPDTNAGVLMRRLTSKGHDYLSVLEEGVKNTLGI